MKASINHDLIYSTVMSIPRGRVATYGQIAEIAGLARRARQVGYALRMLPGDSSIPWHRVVNARGEISRRRPADSVEEQRLLLEDEGVAFDARGRVPLERYRWAPLGHIEAQESENRNG